MKLALTTRALVIGIGLLVAGILIGGGTAYWYAARKQAVAVRQNAAAAAAQKGSAKSSEMAGMPGMDMSSMPGKQNKAEASGSGQDMGNMPGMDMSGKQPQGSAAAPSQGMSNMPGMNMPGSSGSQTPSMESMAPGSVLLDAATQQKIGVTYATVRRARLERTIRTVGLIQMDEEKISRVHVKVAGWIENVYLNYVGKLIKKGQPLFTLYSPDLVSTEQEYLIARKGQQYLAKTPYTDISSDANSLLNATRDRLRLWDISDAQIHDLETSGKAQRVMTLYSPISGFVMTRNAYEQTYVTPETDLYDIADLSTIWVYVDIFEYEAPFVHVGQTAQMQLSYFPGRTYRGKVTYIYPTLDPKTRTIKVRLEFPNPGYELKPDMYADVELNVNYGTQTLVPSEAVLNSGTRQVVFIAKGDGYFEPRDIKIGDQFDGQTVVLAGLKPGEKIVASGNFLIDSESRLGAAMQQMMASMPGMDMGKGKK
ncbi:MAG: efflux RND transporter periplasmic adaptor subunit [Acidobacteriota bacterium]